MITFIFLAVLIITICFAIMLRPLYKPQHTDALERDAQNVHFAKSRLAELNEQLAAKTISQSDYDNLKIEIETILAQDMEMKDVTSSEAESAKKQSNAVVITLLCTLIPFTALILYQITGSPSALDPNNINTQQRPTASTNGQGQDINAMVVSVEQRLKENPNDSQGWTILSQTYMVLERYQEAYNANLKLLEINGESAQIYTQLADSAALVAGGVISGQPSEYIQKALAIDPKYPQALWLAGLNAAQAGDVTQANEYWNTLLPLLANSPQQQQELRDIIAQTIGTASQTESVVANSASSTEKEVAVSNVLTVNLSIAESVQSQANPNDTVFVFARAQSGPPAPLAVKRLTVADLPTQVKLSDQDAMIEQFKLSLFEDVVVVARISKSGDPIAQNGDIESVTTNTKNNNSQPIDLIISEQVVK